MNVRLPVLALLLAMLGACGCSTAPGGASTSTSAAPRARCLVDPNEGSTRPLLYLLCIESP